MIAELCGGDLQVCCRGWMRQIFRCWRDAAAGATPLLVAQPTGQNQAGCRPSQVIRLLQPMLFVHLGVLQGGAVGSSCITLTPGRLACGRHDADTRTAGSCMLLAQSALPCLLYASASGGARGAGDDATAAAGPAAAAAAAPLPAAAAAAPPSKGPAAVPAPAAAGAAAAAPPPPAADAVEAAPAASAAAGTSPTAGPPAGAAAPSPAGPVDESAALGAAAAAGAASFLDLRGGTDAAMAPPAGALGRPGCWLAGWRSRRGKEDDAPLRWQVQPCLSWLERLRACITRPAFCRLHATCAAAGAAQQAGAACRHAAGAARLLPKGAGAAGGAAVVAFHASQAGSSGPWSDSTPCIASALLCHSFGDCCLFE